MNKIKLTLFILTVLAMATAAYALQNIWAVADYPPNDVVWVIGQDNFTFTGVVYGNRTHRPSNATLYSNQSGSWAAIGSVNVSNSSIDKGDLANGSNNELSYTFPPHFALFPIRSTGVIAWRIYGCVNASDGSGLGDNCVYSTNRTIIMRDTPFQEPRSNLYFPDDKRYWLLGASINTNLTFMANITTNSTRGLTNFTLYTNLSGSWAAVNYTNRTYVGTGNRKWGDKNRSTNIHLSPKQLNLPINSTITNFKWAFYVCLNATNRSDNIISCAFSGNRTIHVGKSPGINLSSPYPGSVLDSGTINATALIDGSADAYSCDIYSNETGNYTIEKHVTFLDATSKSFEFLLGNSGHFMWNMRCENSDNSNIFGWNETNSTVIISTAAPVVTINSPSDGGYNIHQEPGSERDTSANITINYTVTGSQLSGCALYINGTYNSTNNTRLVSGSTYILWGVKNSTAGTLGIRNDYRINIVCNASNEFATTSSNSDIIVDVTAPSILTNKTYVNKGSCDNFHVNVTTNEPANATIKWYWTAKNTSASNYFNEANLSFTTATKVPITFNDNYERRIYMNISVCDAGGNCNISQKELDMIAYSPVKLCAGWSLYSIYDTNTSLFDVYTDSQAEFVYYWNQSVQSWIYYSSAATTYGDWRLSSTGLTTAEAGPFNQGDENITSGSVVHLYTSTNTTWFRTNSNLDVPKSALLDYIRELSDGHAYLSVYTPKTFGTLSYKTFQNETNVRPGAENSTIGAVNFRFDYFAGYNNSAQQWVNHHFRWNISNSTTLGNSYTTTGTGDSNEYYRSGVDTLWVFVPNDLTLNMTNSTDATTVLGGILRSWS